jgi:hypothetical protein
MAKKKAGGKAGGAIPTADFSVDPLLVGADREFAGGFPPGLLAECGVVPLRLFRDVGLVCPRSGPAGRKGLERLRKSARVRLVEVPAIHDYAVDLFLRYMEAGDESGPPLWIAESRRGYLTRLGDFRSPQSGPLLASVVLTSPLAATSPILVCPMGGEGHVLYLHGTAGLKDGARFPVALLEGVLARLKIEFGMDGKKSPREPWVEGRGREERGLEDLTGMLLPPLEGGAFVIEPRGVRR